MFANCFASRGSSELGCEAHCKFELTIGKAYMDTAEEWLPGFLPQLEQQAWLKL